jgi:hypothetical protein
MAGGGGLLPPILDFSGFRYLKICLSAPSCSRRGKLQHSQPSESDAILSFLLEEAKWRRLLELKAKNIAGHTLSRASG